jgi:glucosyl-3-phosphoglycerate synthase
VCAIVDQHMLAGTGFAQPLSGEFAGRRERLESIPFCTSYGVETGMLIDTYATRGVDALAQVDLDTKVHCNQPLEALARMVFAIPQAAVHRPDQSRGVALTDADGLSSGSYSSIAALIAVSR